MSYDVVLIKLVSGEELIAKSNQLEWNEKNKSITCRDMCKLLISTNPNTGNPELVLLKYPYFADIDPDATTTINSSAIAYIRKPMDEMIEFYMATYKLSLPEDEGSIKQSLIFATKKTIRNSQPSIDAEKPKKRIMPKDIH
jgi:hypothetical protein